MLRSVFIVETFLFLTLEGTIYVAEITFGHPFPESHFQSFIKEGEPSSPFPSSSFLFFSRKLEE